MSQVSEGWLGGLEPADVASPGSAGKGKRESPRALQLPDPFLVNLPQRRPHPLPAGVLEHAAQTCVDW